KYIQPGYAVIIYIPTYPFYILISSTTKSFISGPCKDDRIDIIVLPAMVNGLNHLHIGERSECIVNLRSVNGNLCYPIKKFKLNVLVFFNGFPIKFIVHNYD